MRYALLTLLFVDGTFETTTQAAFEYRCTHVNYYVRKLAGQGVVRSESTRSSLSGLSESARSSHSRSSSSRMSSSTDGDIVSAPARAMMLPEVADDPWTRYCLAYMYADRLISSCGRNVAAQMASEKFGVRISQCTARQTSILGGPPSIRGAPLIIPREIELKVEELR